MMVKVLFARYAAIRKRIDPGDERDSDVSVQVQSDVVGWDGISDEMNENALDDQYGRAGVAPFDQDASQKLWNELVALDD